VSYVVVVVVVVVAVVLIWVKVEPFYGIEALIAVINLNILLSLSLIQVVSISNILFYCSYAAKISVKTYQFITQ